MPLGNLSFGEFRAEGVVDPDYLEPQLAPLDPIFQACYMRALMRDHATEGQIVLKLTGGESKIFATVVENATGDTELGTCVTEGVATIKVIERGALGPWVYTADWSVTFEIVQPRSRKRESTD